MTKSDALALLKEHVQTEQLIGHSVATAAIMKKLAGKLGADPELWEVTGLLHDLDFESTKDTPAEHCLKTLEMLKYKDLPPEALDAIKMHNAAALGIERSGEFAHALAAAETITGLIVASALVRPDRKLASVKVKSVKKKMKDKRFAANVSREIIMECEQFGLGLDEFIGLSLEAMSEIADTLGL